MRKTNWNTYATYGYSYDVANDQRSAGGVHLHQIRKDPAGWQYRICQSNGGYRAYGPVEPISDADGEAHYATAQASELDAIRMNRYRAQRVKAD